MSTRSPARAFTTVKPNPRLVRLVSYAIDEVAASLDEGEWSEWLAWASSWKAGQRQPQACVDISHRCFRDRENDIGHCLGQIAWAAKEACYETTESGWLVIRYIADAMVAFGVAFPAEGLALLEPPAGKG